MMQNPTTSNTTIQQQTVQEAFHSENKEGEKFYQATDSAGEEIKPNESTKQDFKDNKITPVGITPVTSIRSTVNSKKLKRSATTITPCNRDSDTGRPSSVEEKLINLVPDSEKTGAQQHEATPIIEVKKPPNAIAAWDNVSQITVNNSNENEKSKGDNKNEAVHQGANAVDTSTANRLNSVKMRNASYLKENRIKSNIPRFTKSKPKEKVVNAPCEKNEKKTFSGLPKGPIGKSNSPSRIHKESPNQSWKGSSPSRSRASTISSRPISPALMTFSNNQSKTPSNSASPGSRTTKEKEKEFHSMLEEMCTNLDHLNQGIKATGVEIRPPSASLEKSREQKKILKIDCIMPAKSGAGETFSKIKEKQTCEIDEATRQVSLGFDFLARKADVLQCLSELNNQNQTNLKELHKVITQLTDANDDSYNKQLELQFYNMEQTQIELVQKLVRTTTKFFEDREALLVENKVFRDKQEIFIPEIEERLAILEAENTNLLDKLRMTTQNLEEERAIGQKKKIASQNFAQTKQKIQRSEAKLQQLESKMNDLAGWAKKLEASLKMKESIFEHSAKKIKLAESTINELELENKNFKEEIQYMKVNEKEKLANLIQESHELKDARMQLISLQEKFADEIDRREKLGTKLQDSTSKMRSLEDKCKNLTNLLDSCKKEIKMKDIEIADKEKKLNDEITQLHTELQARKVMLKVAEDEVAMAKNKLEKVETLARQEQMKEKEVSTVEDQLRLDLAVRDEQITQLQEQIKGLIEKKFNPRESARSKNRLTKLSEKHSGSSFNERVALTAQVVDLERTIDSLAKDNLQLNQLLNRKNLELDQRDRIVKMQTEVLKIRDELIFLLKSKEAKHEEDIKRLNDIIQERENAIAKEWNRALEGNNWQPTNVDKIWPKMCSTSSQESDVAPPNPTEESMYMSGTMFDLYSTLEKKQMELEMMQQRVQQLEGMQEAYNQQRTRQEARISKLEMALSEKCLDTSGLVPILAQ